MDSVRTQIYISQREDGILGLYAGQIFELGDVIERAPVYLLPPEEYRELKSRPLLERVRARTFSWFRDDRPKKDMTGAIVYGFMTMCNHANESNAEPVPNEVQSYMELRATRSIQIDDEITLSYHTPEIVEISH